MKDKCLHLIIVFFFTFATVNAQEETANDFSNYAKIDITPRSTGISFFGLNQKSSFSLGIGYYSTLFDTSLNKPNSKNSNPARVGSFPVMLSVHKNLLNNNFQLRAEAAAHILGSNNFDVNRYYHLNAEALFMQEDFIIGLGIKKPFFHSENFTLREYPFLHLTLGFKF